jgi:hypothetical protein
MRGPLYARDEAVWYTRLGLKGRIVNVVNEADPMDRKRQGYRYTVKLGQDLWSVPESGLRGLTLNERNRVGKSRATKANDNSGLKVAD